MAVAARYDSYVDYVIFDGQCERYPKWFEEDVLEDIVMDASRYTRWMPKEERPTDYFDKTVVERDSVFLRKHDGTIHVTDYYVFSNLYYVFYYNDYLNHGVAAYEDDIIEYVECLPGVLPFESPDWFYEYFTEAANLVDEETILWNSSFDVGTEVHGLIWSDHMDGSGEGEIVVDVHCVFLRNFAGSVMYLPWKYFINDFNPGPVNSEFDELDRGSSYGEPASKRWLNRERIV